MNDKLIVTSRIVEETLRVLQDAGNADSERIILWLGHRSDDGIHVVEAYTPLQEAASDYFRIPPEGMARLFDRIRASGTMVAAQVHTHPEVAFHSAADDRWAIVRHEGALSLVLPWFALRTIAGSFARDAATFMLTKAGTWREVDTARHVEVKR